LLYIFGTFSDSILLLIIRLASLKEMSLSSSFQSSRALLYLRFVSLWHIHWNFNQEFSVNNLVFNIFFQLSTKSANCKVYQGGHSSGYKKYIAENELPDETCKEDGVALFRVQGSGPDNMQAIQVEPVCAFIIVSTVCCAVWYWISLFLPHSWLPFFIPRQFILNMIQISIIFCSLLWRCLRSGRECFNTFPELNCISRLSCISLLIRKREVMERK
jgi:hypothetical protein